MDTINYEVIFVISTQAMVYCMYMTNYRAVFATASCKNINNNVVFIYVFVSNISIIMCYLLVEVMYILLLLIIGVLWVSFMMTSMLFFSKNDKEKSVFSILLIFTLILIVVLSKKPCYFKPRWL